MSRFIFVSLWWQPYGEVKRFFINEHNVVHQAIGQLVLTVRPDDVKRTWFTAEHAGSIQRPLVQVAGECAVPVQRLLPVLESDLAHRLLFGLCWGDRHFQGLAWHKPQTDGRKKNGHSKDKGLKERPENEADDLPSTFTCGFFYP
jgi:hypothetical protein